MARTYSPSSLLPNAREFADPNSGGVPQGPGVTWHSEDFLPGEILYLLNQSEVRIDAVVEDPLPVPMEYAMAPLDVFVARLEIESKRTVQPVEGYGFFVS